LNPALQHSSDDIFEGFYQSYRTLSAEA